MADLAQNTKLCTMAIFHQPRFYSSTNTVTVRKDWKIIWDRLYAAGVDLTFSGHMHRYERFWPMTPDGTRDDVNGVKAFIVGTGGEAAPPTLIAPNSQVVAATIGIIKLTLHPDGWLTGDSSRFRGHTFTDSGIG